MVIRPVAEVDLVTARAWYERQREGLGAEFILCVEEALERISRMPAMYAIVYWDIRRVLTRRVESSFRMPHSPSPLEKNLITVIARHLLTVLVPNGKVHMDIAPVRARFGFPLVGDGDRAPKRVTGAHRVAPMRIFKPSGSLAAVLEEPEPHHRTECRCVHVPATGNETAVDRRLGRDFVHMKGLGIIGLRERDDLFSAKAEWLGRKCLTYFKVFVEHHLPFAS